MRDDTGDLSDDRLATLARAGDAEAWETFFRRHAGRLLAYCHRLCGDPSESRAAFLDAAGDAWYRVRSDPSQRPVTVAFAAATRRCARAPLAPQGSRAPRPRDPASLEARADRLHRALLGLPFPERAALGLCYFDNLPWSEASRCLGPDGADPRTLCARGYAALTLALGPGFLSEGLD